MAGIDQKELGLQEEGLPGRNQNYGRDAAINAVKIRKKKKEKHHCHLPTPDPNLASHWMTWGRSFLAIQSGAGEVWEIDLRVNRRLTGYPLEKRGQLLLGR